MNLQKRNVISRKNIMIEESRVFDGEEICNYDKLARLEKRRKEKSMRSRGANGSLCNNETPSNITGPNYHHGRNNSNPYGYSFATNRNMGSAIMGD